jgi:hypothetical protein
MTINILIEEVFIVLFLEEGTGVRPNYNYFLTVQQHLNLVGPLLSLQTTLKLALPRELAFCLHVFPHSPDQASHTSTSVHSSSLNPAHKLQSAGNTNSTSTCTSDLN